MLIGGKQFQTKGHTYVMGILNVTPDSFSDGGAHHSIDDALSHTERMIAEGADIIDVGGQSTRPGYEEISAEEETARTAPVIEAIRREYDIPLSIDTYRAQVARCALDAGANLVNDVSGLMADDEMGNVISDYGAVCVLACSGDVTGCSLQELKGAMKDEFSRITGRAKDCGIRNDRIILDPGIGFQKTYEQNLKILSESDFCVPQGCPVLLGTSRKSVIGLTLDLPASQRMEGTIVTSVLAVQAGAMFVRVHDVLENVRAIKMMEAVLYGSHKN